MNDNHRINENLSLEELRETLTSSIQNDTTPEGIITQLNEGTSQASTQAIAHKKNTPNLRKVFSHRSDDEISENNKPIPYIIKGYIREKGLHMLYGESGCGKGFCILDMCESIARDEVTTWHGKPIKHGDVIYFCGESADGLNARIKAWKNARNITRKGATFEIIDEIFHLDETDKNSDYYIDNIIANIQAISLKPALVVIDPVNIFMAGDENKASDTGCFLSACRKIIDACGCAVLFVQHVGLATEAKNRARGSSAFYAGCDIAMQLKKDNDILTLSVTKNKEGKRETDLLFNLTQHEIPGWFDDDGEAITSCVFELAEKLMQYRETLQAEKQKPKLKPAQQFAMDSFKEAAKLHGEIITDNPDTGHETIRLEDSSWRNYVFDKLPSNNEDSRKDRENKRVKFYNVKKYMTLESHILTIQHEGGVEYYCLNLSGDTEPTFRAEIRNAVKQREETENNIGEAERTANLF